MEQLLKQWDKLRGREQVSLILFTLLIGCLLLITKCNGNVAILNG